MTDEVMENAELSEKNSEKLREYHEKVRTMSKEELEEELESLKEDLVDEETEMRLIIGQTGVHMNVTQATAYRESFNREMDLIKKKIEFVKETLGQ